MERATHTPGPWRTQPIELVGRIVILDASGQYIVECDCIADVDCWGDKKTSPPMSPQLIADAYLIAAAPQLLDAIKAARDSITSGFDTVSTIAKIDRAIAKAEGR